MNIRNPKHPLHEKQIRLAVQKMVQQTLAELINEEKTETSKEFKKIRVKRFFEKLENSSLKNLLKFNNTGDQAEAIVKFADLVGVPKGKINAMVQGLKDASKND
jgi:hypothetical protein